MFKPNYYYENFHQINIELLKKEGIKIFITDLDNTIAPFYELEPNNKTLEFLNKLSNDFIVYCVSNNNFIRVEKYFENTNINLISNAKKPLHNSFKKILEKESCQKTQMIMVGDQLLTDMLGANTFGIKTILVDQIVLKDEWKTKFNRLLEKLIYFILKKQNKLIKGEYYENM